MSTDSVGPDYEGVNPTGEVLFQGGLVKCKIRGKGPPAGGGRRGVVNEFSAASRRNLMELFRKVDWDGCEGKPVFLTLTYGAVFPGPGEAKDHLRAFEERLRRRFPRCSGGWRLEFQDRGAPHFHAVYLGLPFIPKVTIKEWWGQVIGREYWDYSRSAAGEPPFTRIEVIRSKKQLMGYVSKYIGKCAPSPSGATDGAPARGFNLRAYLHAGEFVHPVTGELCGSVGRWWGTFNRKYLPLAAAVACKVWGPPRPLYELRRAARHVWKGVSRRRGQGFSLFVDDAAQWFEYWLHLALEGAADGVATKDTTGCRASSGAGRAGPLACGPGRAGP